MALQLKNRGVARVRPLLGGLEAWLALGFPTEAIEWHFEESGSDRSGGA